MGADDGPAQIPGNGLHRPAIHRAGNVRLQLRQQRRAARTPGGRSREVRARLLAQSPDRYGRDAEDILRSVQAEPGRVHGQRADRLARIPAAKIGRASGRERVCKYVYISVVSVSLKKKTKRKNKKYNK